MTHGTPHLYDREGLHQDIYDVMTAGFFAARGDDRPYFVRRAIECGGPVLELGCGTGRVAWAIAEAGVDVVGLDQSAPMLAGAEAKRADMPDETKKRARFVQGDMAGFSLDTTFAMILIAYRSFQMLTAPEQQRQCLADIRRHLRPGGLVIIDLFDPRLDLCVPDTPGPGEMPVIKHPRRETDVHVEVQRIVTDPVSQCFTERWRLTERDDSGTVVREETEHLTLRWTYRYEMRYLLELAGFAVEAEYSDFTQSPPSYGLEQIWVARAANTGVN